jgi:hypothetical protein
LFELTGDKGTRPTEVIDRFVRPIVARALERPEEDPQDVKETTLLDYLAHVTHG